MTDNPQYEDSFDDLVNEFQNTLKDLVDDGLLQKYNVVFEKILISLKNCHDSKNKLSKQCEELKSDIGFHAGKANENLKKCQQLEDMITSQSTELERAWQVVAMTRENEKENKKTIMNQQNEIDTLSVLVEKGAALSALDMKSVDELMHTNEQLIAGRDELQSELQTLTGELQTLKTQQSEAEEANRVAHESIMNLQQDIQLSKNECFRQKIQNEKLEKDLTQLRDEVKTQQQEIKTLGAECQCANDEQQRTAQQLKEQMHLNDKVSSELEQLQVRYNKLQNNKEQLSLRVEQLTEEADHQAMDLKKEKDAVSEMKLDIINLNKLKNIAQKKMRQTEEQKLELENLRDTLKNKIAGQETEIKDAKKKSVEDKKKINELIRENEVIKKNGERAERAAEDHLKTVKMLQQTMKAQDKEIVSYKEGIRKKEKNILQLEKESESNTNKINDLNQKFLSGMEQLRVRDMEAEELKKTNTELKKKLKQEQKLHEAARAEINNFKRSLCDAQQKIKDMQQNMKLMNQQNVQLTEEINRKEAALVNKHKELQQILKEKENLKADLQKMKQQAIEAKSNMDYKEEEVQRLLKAIADAEAEKEQQKKELNQLTSERDILRCQMLNVEDEQTQLNDKIKVQESILNNVKTQYNKKEEDICKLEQELKKMLTEKSTLKNTVSEVEPLNQQVKCLERELIEERVRRKRLQEELENPFNVHRWRILEGTDPISFELFKRIQCLQQCLISKSQEVEDRDLAIQEIRNQFLELHTVLSRRLSPEETEQLVYYQKILKKKDNVIKARNAELIVYKSQEQEHKKEMERIANAYVAMQRAHLQERKKPAPSKKEHHPTLPRILPQPISTPHQPELTGLSMTSSKTNRRILPGFRPHAPHIRKPFLPDIRD